MFALRARGIFRCAARHIKDIDVTAYVGVALESVIIDSDHWRHAFLLLSGG